MAYPAFRWSRTAAPAATATGRLVGILTNRDVRFASDPAQKIHELMTAEGLVTVNESVEQDQAKKLLHQHRIEKLLVVDPDGHCVGLITVKDIEKSQLNPDASKDQQGRLRVAAATTVGDDGHERAERLIDAGSTCSSSIPPMAIRKVCSMPFRG